MASDEARPFVFGVQLWRISQLNRHRLMKEKTYEARHDTSAVRDAELQSRCHRPLAVSWAVGRKPRKRQANADVQAHGNEEASSIVHARARIAHQHRIPHDTDKAKCDAVQTSPLLGIRDLRHDQVGDSAQSIARDCQNLNHRRARLWPDSSDDRREEGRVAVQHDVCAELSEAERPNLPVVDALLDVAPVELSCTGCVTGLQRESHGSEFLLFVGQEECCTRVVGQNEPCRDAEDHGWQTLDDHDPAPSSLSRNAIHMPNRKGKKATAGASQGRRDEEIPDSECEFTLGVE